MAKRYWVLGIAVGVLAGYGAVSSLTLIFNLVKDQFDSVVVVENVDEPMGGPVDEIKYVETRKKNILQRELIVTTKKIGYSRIVDENYLPNLSATNYMIVDLESGDEVEVDNLNNIERSAMQIESRPIASISKLMTALVVYENMNLSDEITLTWNDIATYGKQGSLSIGERIKVYDLLHALLLESSNDAAEALANAYGRDSFMTIMNTTARKLNMTNTSFHDPSGLSRYNKSSVRDLSRLVRYLYRQHPEILEISDTNRYSGSGHTWYSNNPFRSDSRYIGGKNGYTDDARYTLSSAFRLPLGEEGEERDVNIVLLGSEDVERDMRNVVLYLLRNIEYVEI